MEQQVSSVHFIADTNRSRARLITLPGTIFLAIKSLIRVKEDFQKDWQVRLQNS